MSRNPPGLAEQRALLAASSLRVLGVAFGPVHAYAEATLRERHWPTTLMTLRIAEAKRVLEETR